MAGSGQQADGWAHPHQGRTFHQGSMPSAAVAEVPCVDPLQTVISEFSGVAQALQDGVHETLQEKEQAVSGDQSRNL